ncbi:lantibiotic dehydratase [Actinomadura oligospora]|uniref:lantibiotic dehydratase n=1 Tax=Actinomadura oligospora TaxID=111804 RepID=UPI00047E89F9|nr:lantibiotic dehydratase [Actinomadura oligospora]
MGESVGTVTDEGVALPTGARVKAPPVLRLAGLPAATLDGLRLKETFGLAEEQVRLRQWLAAEGGALSDALFTAIGALRDDALKPRLVGLRRAVYRSRRPRAEEWNPTVAAMLDPRLAERIDGWLSELDTVERLAAELPPVLAAEISDRERTLREVAADPRLRRALSQASPALSAELAKWLADPGRRPRPQTLAQLTKYVARAAAKTSPYSTFTVSGVAAWTDGPSSRAAESGPPVAGVLELDGFLLQTVIRALCAHPVLEDLLRVRANPSVSRAQGMITFSGAPPREAIVTMRETPAVHACLRLLEGRPAWTLTGLRDRLAPDEGARGKVRVFLDGLVEAGLLILEPPVEDQSLDALGDLSAWVSARGGPELLDVVPLLDRLRREVRLPVPVEDVDGHRARQDRLRDAAADLVARLGLPSYPVAEMGKAVFHENAVFRDVPVRCAAEEWRPALDDLDAVRRWLAVFDPALPLRVALGAYFRERFGAGESVTFLSLCRAVHEEIAREGGPGGPVSGLEVARFLRASPLASGAALAASPLGRLRELGRIQEEARRAVLGPPDVDGVVRTPAARLRALAAGWPEWIAPAESLGCYVQTVGSGHRMALALNVAHAGYGRGRSRTTRLTALADGAGPLHRDRHEDRAGTVFAELSGVFSSALNARTPSTDYEIDYPFTVSGRPAGERLPVGDLMAVHDPRTDLVDLVSTRLGARVVPLHLGMMADVLLPSLAQFMTWAFGVTYYLHPSFSPLATEADLTPPAALSVQPRVETGRVVLRRARWRVPTAQVPTRGKGEGDADYLVRLLGWLRANGIPDRCYVRMWTEGLWDTDPEDSAWGKWVLDKSRKPVYVDFSNWYLVAVFERMLRAPGPVMVFEEALPAPADATTPAEAPAVAEYLVEISNER